MPPVPTVDVLLAAGGSGSRFGSAIPKTLLPCAGRSLWEHAAAAFEASGFVRRIVVVVPADHAEAFGDTYLCVIGGTTRAASVRRGLEFLKGDPPDLVAVHDAARPLVTVDEIDRAIAAAAEHGAAFLATPVTSTLKRGRDEQVVETVSRDDLWAAQTPQVARFDWLLVAHNSDGASTATDDAELLQRAGRPVRIVTGAATNLKVTTPDDLMLAEALLARRAE